WDRAIYLTSTSMNQVVTTAFLATICVTCKPVEKRGGYSPHFFSFIIGGLRENLNEITSD
ncbi:hypothetical protein ABE944_15185, partial [Enterococcus faecalis]|uniref:hypothetical protein n=1 Tax=Enterococcus faecalis TaxID=1351 RepID=UPI003D6B64C0